MWNRTLIVNSYTSYCVTLMILLIIHSFLVFSSGNICNKHVQIHVIASVRGVIITSYSILLWVTDRNLSCSVTFYSPVTSGVDDYFHDMDFLTTKIFISMQLEDYTINLLIQSMWPFYKCWFSTIFEWHLFSFVDDLWPSHVICCQVQEIASLSRISCSSDWCMYHNVIVMSCLYIHE